MHWIARRVFLHGLGLIYSVAFLVAIDQNEGLIGSNGLTPAPLYMERLKAHYLGANHTWELRDKVNLYSKVPTLLWFVPKDVQFNVALQLIQVLGLLLSLIPLIVGGANVPVMLAIWLLYQSITNVGQNWYSFGWEAQTLETGFLAIFLCPWFTIEKYPKHLPTPIVVVWCYRWLLFRIYLGAGLIKLRGDSCWRDLTCMNYHYETSCVPNPLSWLFHNLPWYWHSMEVLFNHVVQLVMVPMFMLMPRVLRQLGAMTAILEMVLITSTGNYGFLNHLTMLPALFAFDDEAFIYAFHRKEHDKTSHFRGLQDDKPLKLSFRNLVHWCLGTCIVYMSIPITANLLSSRQIMNTSFDPFSIVNTYGAFGSVGKVREEIVIKGTNADVISNDTIWHEFEFKCKPGDVSRRPCILAPYHYRIDWVAWFAGFQEYQHHPWLLNFVFKMLHGDEGKVITPLIANNPFEDRPPPRFIKVDRYRYSFTSDLKATDWWERELLESRPFLPPLSLENESLRKYIESNFNY